MFEPNVVYTAVIVAILIGVIVYIAIDKDKLLNIVVEDKKDQKRPKEETGLNPADQKTIFRITEQATYSAINKFNAGLPVQEVIPIDEADKEAVRKLEGAQPAQGAV